MSHQPNYDFGVLIYRYNSVDSLLFDRFRAKLRFFYYHCCRNSTTVFPVIITHHSFYFGFFDNDLLWFVAACRNVLFFRFIYNISVSISSSDSEGENRKWKSLTLRMPITPNLDNVNIDVYIYMERFITCIFVCAFYVVLNAIITYFAKSIQLAWKANTNRKPFGLKFNHYPLRRRVYRTAQIQLFLYGKE